MTAMATLCMPRECKKVYLEFLKELDKREAKTDGQPQ